ncbi:MAG TPA: SRPBCC domain-containing protein [Streptosporangiaceae bacterium]|nr:SRPBCC domain-containing protein [Streptosporangiaceae bacterium]
MVADSVSVKDAGPLVRSVVVLPGCSMARAMSAFTNAPLLARWWGGGELSTELTVGGPYLVRFPALGRTMTGRVLGYEPDRQLEFSWSWDGQEETGRTVTVNVCGGQPVSLTIEHGSYGDTEADLTARAEHRAGWQYFLPQLAATLTRG